MNQVLLKQMEHNAAVRVRFYDTLLMLTCLAMCLALKYLLVVNMCLP